MPPAGVVAKAVDKSPTAMTSFWGSAEERHEGSEGGRGAGLDRAPDAHHEAAHRRGAALIAPQPPSTTARTASKVATVAALIRRANRRARRRGRCDSWCRR